MAFKDQKLKYREVAAKNIPSVILGGVTGGQVSWVREVVVPL